jgi:hypothetical protein
VDVLIQCFQRRCLTYTPSNPDGWRVEAGNIGQHYYAWRYGADAAPRAPAADLRIAELWPGDPYGALPDDEYIALQNAGGHALDLAGWMLRDQQGDVSLILASYELRPGDEVKLSSCGLNDTVCGGWWDYPDFAELFDPNGTLVAYAYVSGQGGVYIWDGNGT